MQLSLALRRGGESKLNSLGSALDGVKRAIGQAARRHPHRPRADEGDDNQHCGNGLRQPQGLPLGSYPGLHQDSCALLQTTQQAGPRLGLFPPLPGYRREQLLPPRRLGRRRGHSSRRLANQHRRPQQGAKLGLVLRVTRQHFLKANFTGIQLRETLIESALKSPPHCLSLLSIPSNLNSRQERRPSKYGSTNSGPDVVTL